MARSTYHHGNLRAALVAAGLKILARRGLSALTLRAAAAEAGVSPAAPYRHFADATALAAAIAEEGFTRLAGFIDAALAEPALRRLSALERAGHGYVRFALAHPDHHRLMFSGRIAPGARGEALAAAGRRAYEALTKAIDDARRRGLIDAGTEPALLAVAAWSLVHGMATLLIEELVDPAAFGCADAAALLTACQRILRQGWAA